MYYKPNNMKKKITYNYSSYLFFVNIITFQVIQHQCISQFTIQILNLTGTGRDLCIILHIQKKKLQLNLQWPTAVCVLQIVVISDISITSLE